MKKIVIPTGVGFPIRTKYLRYVSDSLEEVVKAVCNAFAKINTANDGVLLTGTITVTTTPHQVLSISDAYIFFNGEVFHVPAQSLQATSDSYPYWHFTIATTTDITGTYKDGVTRATTEKRELTLETRDYGVACPSGSLDYANGLKDINNVWCAKKQTSYSAATLETGWASNSGNAVKYRLNDIGQLDIVGQFKVDGSPSNLLFTLAEGYRPTIEQTITIFAKATQYSIAEKPINVTIGTNGQVTISQYEVMSDGYYCFSNTILI